MKTVLVTGAAGFIGFHLCKSLIKDGHSVIGVDNINDYYEDNLKFARLNQLGIDLKSAKKFSLLSKSTLYSDQFYFTRINIENDDQLRNIFSNFKFDVVCNLAAQAGVRYSIENPKKYIESNINGFINILECCRHFQIPRLVYASSSSVYGNNSNIPFRESDFVDNPISLYAATKKSNELMAYTYSHLYKFETVGLRFFTVYGPWGRPDMAYFIFTNSIFNNKPINIFNNGNLSRDYTYIDDIVTGIDLTLFSKFKDQELHKIYNLGNGKPVNLLKFVKTIEKIAGVETLKNLLPMQPGDVYQTFADNSKFSSAYNFKPKFDLNFGINEFIKWYRQYYNI